SGAGAVAESPAPAGDRVASRASRAAGRERGGSRRGWGGGGGRAAGGERGGSRGGGAAVRDRDLVAELERLLLIVVQFLPRLAARVRLRAADERLGGLGPRPAVPPPPPC